MNRMEEIEARLSAIANEIDRDGADIDALGDEVKALKEEKRQLAQNMEKRAQLRKDVAAGEGEMVKRFSAQAEQKPSYTAASPEYRSAFLKNLLGQELTREERAAFVATTANTAAVLPTTMLNQIWDLVSTQHAIMGDITIYRTGTILEVVKHTAIAQGKAKKVAENAANDDEQNTFVKVTLSGNDFSKHVDITYAMSAMSMDALEQYLVNEIANSLGQAMAEDVVAQIGNDMNAANKVTTAAVKTVTFAEIAQLFGKLKRVGNVVAYMTRATLYNYLVALSDASGKPIYQTNAQEGALGAILGATVKIEDAVADNVILVGDPGKVVYNMIQDVMIESDKDIKKHVITYSGYARGSGALIDDVAFAQLSVKQS